MGLFRVSTEFNEESFPELPKLEAAKRARLFTYILMLEKSLETYIKLSHNSEYVHAIAGFFAAMENILFDGHSSVEEYLSVNYPEKCEIFEMDIIASDEGGFYGICPYCKNAVYFNADKKECLEALRNLGGIRGCCPSCKFVSRLHPYTMIDVLLRGKTDV